MFSVQATLEIIVFVDRFVAIWMKILAVSMVKDILKLSFSSGNAIILPRITGENSTVSLCRLVSCHQMRHLISHLLSVAKLLSPYHFILSSLYSNFDKGDMLPAYYVLKCRKFGMIEERY